MKHPLLNPNSKHYQKEGCKPAIQELEEQLNIYECLGYARGNIIKYSYRIDQKGQVKSDAEKLKTYEKYFYFLLDILPNIAYFIIPKDQVGFLLSTPMSEVYKLLNIEIDYSL